MNPFGHFTFSVFIAVSCCNLAHGQKGSFQPTALINATLVTVSGDTLTGATLVIRDGKIDTLGRALPTPPGVKVVDCAGMYVFPGLIDSGTRLGLVEVTSEPRTQDFDEWGDVVPQMKALTAVNPNSALIPVTRVGGVTTVLSRPQGGLFSGTAALIDLYGYTPDQMFGGFEGVVLQWPVSGRVGYFDNGNEEELRKKAEKAVKKLNDVWEQVAQFHRIDSAMGGEHSAYQPEMEALLPVYRGEQALLIEVNRERDIRAAIQWVGEKNIPRVIFTGVAEGWRAAKELAEARIPVVTGPVTMLPVRNYDRYDAVYANAGLLHKAGVKVALRTNGAENARNLAFHAGFAAAYGLGKEQALKAVTLVPAEIFGVADRRGTLDAGKEATLFVCDGDPFEPATTILHVFINGWQVPLESRQTRLYDEFLHREPGLREK